MEFDLFDKLSDLETKIHLQKEELAKKDTYIKQLLGEKELLQKEIDGHLREINGYRKSQLTVPVPTFDQETQTEAEVQIIEPNNSESAFAG